MGYEYYTVTYWPIGYSSGTMGYIGTS